MSDLIVGALAGCFAFLMIISGVLWAFDQVVEMLREFLANV